MPGSDVPYLAYFYPGVVLMVVLFASIFTTASVIEDRHRGFLQSVQAAPGSRAALVVGKSLGSAVGGAHAGRALPRRSRRRRGSRWTSIDWPLLVAALALAAVALAALGFAVAWGLDHVQGYHAIQMTVLVPLWVVSGAMFPAPEGHPALAAALRANPLAHAVSAARRALAGPSAPGVLPGSAARDLAFCALFAASRARPRRPRLAEARPHVTLGELLPPVNATLNATSAVLARARLARHPRAATARATARSCSRALRGVAPVPRGLPDPHRAHRDARLPRAAGALRAFYLAVLASHTLLAAARGADDPAHALPRAAGPLPGSPPASRG